MYMYYNNNLFLKFLWKGGVAKRLCKKQSGSGQDNLSNEIPSQFLQTLRRVLQNMFIAKLAEETFMSFPEVILGLALGMLRVCFEKKNRQKFLYKLSLKFSLQLIRENR